MSSEVTPLGDGLSPHTPKPSTLSSRSTGHLLQDAYLGLSRWKPGSLWELPSFQLLSLSACCFCPRS